MLASSFLSLRGLDLLLEDEAIPLDSLGASVDDREERELLDVDGG
jgi:hypothetical protein